MNMPQLRFKEFNESWAVKTLGELFNIVVGFVGTISDSYCEERDGILFIRTLNVREGRFSLSEIQYVTTEFHERNKKSQIYNNDILIARVGANMGMVCKVAGLENEANSANVIIIKSNSTNHSDFYSLYLNSPKGQKQIQAKGAGGAQEVLNISVAKTIIVPVPSLPEQTKIANFLTAIDEKITQLTQKHDLLKQYKKGVMQQIFSQKLRFKDDDGREFPEWEEKTFGDIFSFVNTNSHSRELLSYENGNVKNIHYGDIHTKYKSYFKIEDERVPYIKNSVDLSKISSEHYCKVGDLVIADASEDYNDIGKTIEIINLNSEKLLAGLHTYIARDTTNTMALGFSGYLMQAPYVRLQIKTLATGVSVLGISKTNIAKVKINIPTKPEQTKIANFLTAIDDKITQTQTQTQLGAVKQYKKGLLQQMFV